MTQPKTDLAYLRSEKAKAEQQLRYYQHREKILEHQIPELTRKARVHRLCTRAGMLESFLIAPEELTNDQVIFDERFASMRELNRRGKTPDPEHYEVTYYADLPAMWQDVPSNEVLEELFQVFNLSRPQDFEGHSLSVSDVIALKRNGEVSVHYVDSIGFKDLQGFLDKKPERASVLMNLKEKCDAPVCNPTVCRKARDAHEL